MFGLASHIGLVVDHTGIRFAKVKTKKSRELVRKGFLPFEPDWVTDNQFVDIALVGSALKQWAKKNKLVGADVILSVPTSQVIIRKLRIEASSLKELKQLIELEVDTTLHLPFDNPIYDYKVTNADEGVYEVLIYASPRKWTSQCMQLLGSIGIKVKQIELPANALARGIQEFRQISLENTMVIHFDKFSVELYMFHNGNPVFMRSMNEIEIAATEEEELAPELVAGMSAEFARMFSFYQYSIHDGNSRITNTVIAGNPGGGELLVEEFRQLQPDMQVDVVRTGGEGRSKQAHADDFLVPYGLALQDSAAKEINLLPEKEPGKSRLSMQLVVISSLWLIAMATLIGFTVINASETKQLTQEADTLARQNSGWEQQLNNLNSQSNIQADPEAVIELITEYRQDAVSVIDSLNGKLPFGSAIQTIEYSKPGGISLIIRFMDEQHIANYLHELRIMPFTGEAILQGYTGTESEWTARYQLKWLNEKAAGEQEGGA